ncbi:MAG: hypothetical protein GXY82_01295 [Methanospirillum sp.]|nr:hypothetical protein [Methanospirillum sp.]
MGLPFLPSPTPPVTPGGSKRDPVDRDRTGPSRAIARADRSDRPSPHIHRLSRHEPLHSEGVHAASPGRNLLRLVGLVVWIALLVSAVSGVSTEVRVVKLASDGKTVLAEKTADYRWLESNLPVKGDGSTHYYHQGPTFDDADLWDPTESKNVEDKDMGAVKGTALRDLCGMVGGMQSGDTLVVRASDGFSKRFSYGSVYSPSSRQGQIVLAWYRAGEGYVPSYSTGMRLVFFADTSVNPWGWHVFGNSDMKASMPQSEWHYFNGVYPTTTGLSVQSVNELRIMSSLPAKTTPPTTPVTPTPSATPKPTPTKTQVATATTTVGPTATTTTPSGGATLTTTPTASHAATPVQTTAGTATVPETVTTATAPTTGLVTATSTGITVPPTTAPVTWPSTAAPDQSPDGGTEPTPAETGSPGTVPPGGETVYPIVPNETPGQVPVTTPTVNETASVSPSPVPTGYDTTTDWSVTTGVEYSVDVAGTETPWTTTVTTAATDTPRTSAESSPVPAPDATDAPLTAITPSPAPTAAQGDRGLTRSLSFTLSFQVRESGSGGPVVEASDGAGGFISPLSPFGTIWAFFKHIGRLIDPFFT